MIKKTLTFILPSMSPIEDALVYKSYIASDIRDRLYVQFVYLRNGQFNADESTSRIEKFDTHEILYVPHDRFFGGCDENFMRSQDFMGILMPHVLIIGDDDIIDWEELEKGLQFFEDNALDAMGLHFTSCQLRSDGNYSKNKLLAPIGIVGPSCTNTMALFEGKVMDSSIAYMSLLSQCGFYWPTFIGSHIYSRDVYIKISQYIVPDVLYSYFYKQVLFFCNYHVRYALFMPTIVYQLSTNFLRLNNGDYPWKGYTHARAAHGRQRIEQMCHLANSLSLEEDVLFNAYIHSVGMANWPAPNEEQAHTPYSMLNETFSWSRGCVANKLHTPSHYFPDIAYTGSLQDIRFLYLYWNRIVRCIRDYPKIYSHFTSSLTRELVEVVTALKEYLQIMDPDRSYLDRVFAGFVSIQGQLLTVDGQVSFEKFYEMNLMAFDAYLDVKTKEIAALPTIKTPEMSAAS